MLNPDREHLKSALRNLAAWLVDVSDRDIPLGPTMHRGALLSSLVVRKSGKLSGGDLAAFFAGAASDRIITSFTAEDVRNIDEALVELSWFIPPRLAREISLGLHPRARLLRHEERIAC